MIRLHLVGQHSGADHGIYEAESEAQVWEMARDDHPDPLEPLGFFSEIQAPALVGNASPDAQTAFETLVRHFVADCRGGGMDADRIALLVRDYFEGYAVQTAISLTDPMPWLTLIDPAATPYVYHHVRQTLGAEDVERIEQATKKKALESAARSSHTGRVGIGASHIYRFVQMTN